MNDSEYQNPSEPIYRKEYKTKFTKGKYYGITFSLFAFLSFTVVLLIWIFSFFDVGTILLRSQNLPYLAGFTLFSIIYIIVYSLVLKKMSIWFYLPFSIVFFAAVSFLFSLVISYIWTYNNFNINQVVLALLIPVGIMFIAGLIGMNPLVPINKIWFLLSFGTVALFIVSLATWLLGGSTIIIIFMGLASFVYFLVTIVDMYILKGRAEYVARLGDRMSRKEITILIIESSLKLFTSYIIYVYYITRLLQIFKR